MREKLFPFLGCIVVLIFVSCAVLVASEDVLDDEPSPAESNVDSKMDSALGSSSSSASGSASGSKKLFAPKHFDWIYSTVIIKVYFDDGSLRQGFGLLLKNGFYLTSSELTYNRGLYPKQIVAKMQDDSAKPLICVAKLQLKAMDSDKGLALLKTTAFTDDYCNTRSESYYHKRIYDKYGKNIFSTTPTKKLILGGLYFPILEDFDTLGVGRTIPIKEESYYDNYSKKEIFYGYSLPLETYQRFTFGKPYFNKDGEFLGIFSVAAQSYLPALVKKEIVQDFICELKKKNIFMRNSPPCVSEGT
ncbi:hypothetical protein [Helicobacter sp. 11S02596-1]|uniref:hypothetical protein n=1 Tax=Helicobacter sp. 11S02596-1 TaxID=1476194 RepID=UPI000BA75741|nr:hypothetical protein [Helicobacter sp. 11S02596-1]PAF42092.1 hypothetical protein BJI48_07205 [Helicobacter sp. 11S02596-1]